VKRKISLTKTFSLVFTILIVFTALVVGFLWIRSTYTSYEKELVILQENHVADVREIIRTEVDRLVDESIRQDLSIVDRLKENISSRTLEAYAIAENIYSENQEFHTDEEIKNMIIDALRPIRFNDGRGYYFIVSLDGIEEMYPVFPEFEGQNVYNLQDDAGNYVIQDEIEVINTSGEGYIEDFWKRPGMDEGLIYPKISYVKAFEPLNCYIGTGDYIIDVKIDVQNERLQKIDSKVFGNSENQNIYVIDYGGNILANSEFEDSIGDSILGQHDADGLDLYKLQLATALMYPEGRFINSRQEDLEDETVIHDTSTYIRAVDEWQWIIGSRFYEDEINEKISEIESKLSEDIKQRITSIVLAVASVLLLATFVFFIITYFIRKNFTMFEDFLKKATTENISIDQDQILFKEFEILAVSANMMIDERTSALNHIKKLSNTDGLTQLFNHRYIYELLDKSILLQIKTCVILFDIDDFKGVNDIYGHIKGDQVLKRIAEIMTNNVRETDFVGRYGGEEFLILLPEASADKTQEIGIRILEQVSANDFNLKRPLTLSAGISVTIEGESATNVVNRADEALYKSKHNGKNQVNVNISQENIL
jgi:diguanylate cyclase (GGDEF)-like protein